MLSIFRRLLLAAVVIGFAAGLAMTAVQSAWVLPIIHEAETYEHAAEPAHDHGAAASPMAATPSAHVHDGEAWEPADGVERLSYTALAMSLLGIGQALALLAVMRILQLAGWRAGLMTGLAAFVSVVLAPSLGLPPEVPGTAAAELADRQVWWGSTIALTAGGIACLFVGRSWPLAVLGVAALALPHVIGAPQPLEHVMAAPANLAHEFATATRVTMLLFWAAIGTAAGVALALPRFGLAQADERTDRRLPATA